jgi:hypothetical protein
LARTLHAYLPVARMPARAALQAAIRQLKFKLSLDEAYAPFEVQGYLPCTLEGEDAGMDMRFERDVAWPAGAAVEAPEGPARMLLRWGGDVREHLSALIIAAALADGFGATVVDPDSGRLLSAASLRQQAQALVDENF